MLLTKIMEKEMKKPLSFAEATRKMKQLEGVDLHELAETHGVTVVNEETGLVNKGWAGVTLERCLGIDPSNHGPDGGSWELKTVPVYEDEDGEISIKETAAITMILGTGDFTLKFGDFALGGIGTATFGAIGLYALLNRKAG